MLRIKRMVKFTNCKIIQVQDWDDLVQKTYNKPYSFQQQDDCKDRGIEYITVPCEDPHDYDYDTIPEIVNGRKMGVSFKAWLERDPTLKIPSKDNFNLDFTELWWDRNFYPDVSMIINDLYSKGLLEAGEYGINIDW